MDDENELGDSMHASCNNIEDKSQLGDLACASCKQAKACYSSILLAITLASYSTTLSQPIFLTTLLHMPWP
jgi:hypothetical protein